MVFKLALVISMGTSLLLSLFLVLYLVLKCTLQLSTAWYDYFNCRWVYASFSTIFGLSGVNSEKLVGFRRSWDAMERKVIEAEADQLSPV